jgi:hypothetical protein
MSGGRALMKSIIIALIVFVICGCATSGIPGQLPSELAKPRVLEYDYDALAGKLREALADCCPEVFVSNGKARTFVARYETEIRKNIGDGKSVSVTYHVHEQGFILMVHVAVHEALADVPKEFLGVLENGESYWEATYLIGEKKDMKLNAALRWGPKADRRAIEITRQTIATYVKEGK